MKVRRDPGDADLAQRLTKMAIAEPWTTMALLMLLTREQWRQLRSQEVFTALHKRLRHMAHARIQSEPACLDSAEDVSQTILLRIAEKDWLRNFVESRGSAGGYLNGVMKCQLNDVMRSLLRLKRRRLHPLYDGDNVPDRTVEDNEDTLLQVRQLVADLPEMQRNGLMWRFPMLADGNGRAPDAQVRHHAAAGLKKLREWLRHSL